MSQAAAGDPGWYARLASSLTPASLRFPLWIPAMTIDLGTPCLALRHSARVPPDSSHLPERFRLFTLIQLGELVVVMALITGLFLLCATRLTAWLSTGTRRLLGPAGL